MRFKDLNIEYGGKTNSLRHQALKRRMKFPKLMFCPFWSRLREYSPMGALGEELMDTDTVFPEGSLVADALHSVSTVDSPSAMVTLVPDCSVGTGPVKTAMDMIINI